uniref:ARAD1A16082p n=1 Tax=Blastobotrys adeninivorans TaxID=409370 RepID=A0A060SZ10_BLAAD
MRPFKRPKTDVSDDSSMIGRPATPASRHQSPPSVPDRAEGLTPTPNQSKVLLTTSNFENPGAIESQSTDLSQSVTSDQLEELDPEQLTKVDGENDSQSDNGNDSDSDGDSSSGSEELEGEEGEILKHLEDCIAGSNDNDDGIEKVLVSPELASEIQHYLVQHGALRMINTYTDMFSGEDAEMLAAVDSDIPAHQPSGKYPTTTIFAALGFALPLSIAEKYEDEKFQKFLLPVIKHFLQTRKRLPYPRKVEEFCEVLKKAKNVLVITGAGISTSLGIPDFRSEKTGLYSRLEHLGLSDPQEVFDIHLFREDPSIFYSIAREILPGSEKRPFSPTHAFIKLLHDKGKLLRNYTQNIDNIEANAGVPPEKLVQCHGSFATVTCQTCGYKDQGETIYADIRAAKVPKCPKCTPSEPPSRKASNDSDDDDDDYGQGSAHVLKPDITFFGEPLPHRFDDLLFGPEGDAAKCDLVICIGTSLKVAPVSEIIRIVSRDTPQVYISKTAIRHNEFDVTLLGPSDDVVEWLVDRINESDPTDEWDLRHDMNRRHLKHYSATEFPDGIIEYQEPGTYLFQETKPSHSEGQQDPKEELEEEPKGPSLMN